MRLASSRVGYCVLLALAGVALRVAIADHVFFRLHEIPAHDLSQGLAFFATSMHSIRVEGDVAWWYPGSFTGYAQYFQGFFSPLAPTYGHVVFIAWAHAVALLASLGLHLPEYVQYLAVNYLVLPFLAFAAFAYFCALLFRRRESVALAMLAYVLSSIGLWNSAWFFFQEAFSLFFLLAAALALLQRPTPARMLVALAAVLVQLASINYWTVYNLFFFAIVVGAYAATHRNQAVRLAVRLRAMVRARPRLALLAGGVAALAGVAWLAVIGAALAEQSGDYVRRVYTADDAVARMVELRRHTLELFNPTLERALQGYFIINPMHNARYIGAALLPLVLLGALAGPGRRARWLLISATLVLGVVLGTPLVVHAWVAVPFMDRIVHLLYFYSQYWQILLVLLAAMGLDVLLGPAGAAARRTAIRVFGAAIVLAVGVMAGHSVVSHRFYPFDANLEANLRSALLLGVPGAIFLRALRSARAGEMRFAAAALLLVMLLDLSWYFDAASRADVAFTAKRGWAGATPGPEQRAALRSAWPAPRPGQGWTAGTEHFMPIQNELWPANYFMQPRAMWTPDGRAAPALWTHARSSPPMLFYDGALVERAPALRGPEDVARLDQRLLVAEPGPGPLGHSAPRVEGFAYRWKEWRYNGFRFEVDAPADGWLMVRQLHDPAWRVSVGGREVRPLEANAVAMAIPLERGTHDVRMEYLPLARRLYWPAAFLLEAALAVVLTLAWRARRPPAPH